MPLDSAKQSFAAFLSCPIERYPISSVPLSLSPQRDGQKEIIFQQSLHLGVAAEYVSIKPWVVYFATIKHFHLMSAKNVSTAVFNDLNDKAFAAKVASTAENLQNAAGSALDDQTKQSLEFLCTLQEAASLLLVARSSLDTIASSPHYKAVLRAKEGAKPSTQTGGCAFLAALIGGGIVIDIIVNALSGTHAQHVARAIILTITIPLLIRGLLSSWRRYSREVAARVVELKVSQLLVSYKTDVVPVAELLAGGSEGPSLARKWLENPPQGREYFENVSFTRSQWEETYLKLDDTAT
jgi:hypothetical protein